MSDRGLDNRVYYMLAPKGQYYNYSGCGNTLNCNHPVVRRFIVDCLRYWARSPPRSEFVNVSQTIMMTAIWLGSRLT